MIIRFKNRSTKKGFASFANLIWLFLCIPIFLYACIGNPDDDESIPAFPVALNTQIFTPPAQTSTVQKSLTYPWSDFERRLSAKLALSSEGKCEWEVLGWQENTVYLWALCLSAPMPNATGASMPLTLTLDEEGSIVDFQQPSDGTLYPPSIQKLFPPEVQKKIFANQFDGAAAQIRIEKRWLDPGLPPLIYEQTGQVLPKLGEPSLPFISINTIDRLHLITQIGRGVYPEVEDLSFSSDLMLDSTLAVLYDNNAKSSILTHWTVPEGDLIFQQAISPSNAVEFVSQPSHILTAGSDATVSLFEPKSGSLEIQTDPFPDQMISLENYPYGVFAGSLNRIICFPPFPNQIQQTQDFVPEGDGWVTDVDFESRPIAVTSDGAISVFDPEDKTVKHTLLMDASGYGYTAFVKTAHWPDLLSAQYQTLYHWQYDKDNAAWNLISKWETPAVITAFTLSPDDSLLVLGLSDGSLQLLDWEQNTLLRSLEGNGSAITALDFSAFGDFFASGSADGVVTLWGIQ